MDRIEIRLNGLRLPRPELERLIGPIHDQRESLPLEEVIELAKERARPGLQQELMRAFAHHAPDLQSRLRRKLESALPAEARSERASGFELL